MHRCEESKKRAQPRARTCLACNTLVVTPPRTAERLPPPWLLVTLGVLLGALLAATSLWMWRTPESPSVTTTRPTPSVLLAVRDLARLEATEMHMERVIQMTDTQRVLFGMREATDSILLVAAADVVAGVDLSTLPDNAIAIDEATGAVTLTLPHAVIFSARLDGARTFVHNRDTDLLAERREDLESRARVEAERTLSAAALEAGIVMRAEVSVRRTLTSLVNALGHDQVTVQFE